MLNKRIFIVSNNASHVMPLYGRRNNNVLLTFIPATDRSVQIATKGGNSGYGKSSVPHD